VGIVKTATTKTGFEISIRDDKGVDYSSSQTATVHWLALKV